MPNKITKLRDKNGRFLKGHQPTNGFVKGHKKNLKKMPEKAKKKMSETAKRNWARGKGNGFKKGNKLWDNEKVKKTQFKKGQKSWITGKKAPWAKNLPQAFERGQRPWNWDGGKSKLRNRLWHCWKYRQWHSDIFERDDYTCQECGLRGCKLEAHHIEQLAVIIKRNKIKTYEEAMDCEEIWNINNGLTLCCKCHNKTKNGNKI